MNFYRGAKSWNILRNIKLTFNRRSEVVDVALVLASQICANFNAFHL